MSEYLMQGDIPVGTRVFIKNAFSDTNDDEFGTVVNPPKTQYDIAGGKLWIQRDSEKKFGPTYNYRRALVEVVEEPHKDFYHVYCGLSTDPLKVFDNLEKAREFRDGFNAALAKVYASSNHINFKAKIVQEVEETKIVKVKKEIQ